MDAIRTAARAPRAARIAVVLLLSTQAALAQEERGAVGEAVKLAHTSAVPANVVRGAVVDSVGSPLVGAQVFLEGTRVGALSDSLGLFMLEGPSGGTYVLRVRLIGYVEQRVNVELTNERGIATLVTLPLSDLQLCVTTGWMGEPIGSVRAYVREVLHGRAPPTRITLRVRAEGGEEFSYHAVRTAYRAVYLAAGEGLGPFDVTITADGYEPWTRTGVVLETDSCGITSEPFRVWLLPAGESQGDL